MKLSKKRLVLVAGIVAIVIVASVVGIVVYADTPKEAPPFEYELKDRYDSVEELNTAVDEYMDAYYAYHEKYRSCLPVSEWNKMFEEVKERRQAVIDASNIQDTSVKDSSFDAVIRSWESRKKENEERLQIADLSTNKVGEACLYANDLQINWYKEKPERVKLDPYIDIWTYDLEMKYIDPIWGDSSVEFDKENYTKEWKSGMEACEKIFDMVDSVLKEDTYNAKYQEFCKKTNDALGRIIASIKTYCEENNITMNEQNKEEIVDKGFEKAIQRVEETQAKQEAKEAKKAGQSEET